MIRCVWELSVYEILQMLIVRCEDGCNVVRQIGVVGEDKES